jgi:hypothetical protein
MRYRIDMLSVFMKEIMRMNVTVRLAVMVMDMFVDQVYIEQKFFVIKYLISRPDFCDLVVLGEYCHPGVEF